MSDAASGAASSSFDSHVARIRAGDIRAFEQLYAAYVERLWQFAFRYVRDGALAEDVVQDVFRSMWERRETLEVRGSLDVYLHGAVRNRALDTIRRNARHDHAAAVDPFGAAGVAEIPALPDEAAQRADLVVAIRRFLETLPPPVGQILHLRWQHGMPYDDIAAALGITSAQARQQVHRVLQRVGGKLRRLID